MESVKELLKQLIIHLAVTSPCLTINKKHYCQNFIDFVAVRAGFLTNNNLVAYQIY